MKSARLLIIVFGTLLAACLIVLGLALTPSIQRWAILRAVGDVPGLKLELATVSGGFSGVTLTGVRAEQRQVVLTVESLEADFSPLKMLFARQLGIQRLHVVGMHVDASRVSRTKVEAAAAGAPAATPGLLARLELPFDLTLEDVRIAGRALVPGTAGQPPVEAEYTVTGGGFASGQEGMLQLNATVRNPAPEVEVAVLHVQAGLRATLTPLRNFNKVSLTSLVEAEGRALTERSQLKVAADLFRTSTGESYEIAVSTVLHGASENVLGLHAQLPAGSRQYAGDWELKARTAQLVPFFLGGALPDFDLKGAGRFALDAVAQSFSAQGGLQGRISRLEVLDPAWSAFGLLRVDSTFDVSQQDGLLHLAQFKTIVSGDKPVLEASTTAPVRYDLRKGQLLADGVGDGQLLHVTLHGLPLDWVRPFITVADVSGGLITGQLDLMRAPDVGTAASVRGKFHLAELNIVQAGRPLLTKATVTAQAEATFAGGAINAPVLDLSVTTPTGDSLTLKGRLAVQAGVDAPVSVAGRFNAATAQLLARWLPGAPVRAEGEIDFTLRGRVVEFQPGRLELRQDAARPMLSVTFKQPFSFDLTGHALVPRDAAQPVARIELGRLPLGLLPLTQPDTTLGGAVAQGDFELTAPEGKIVLRPLSPLRVNDISLTQKRQTALTGLALEASPSAEYSAAAGFRFETGEVTVRNAGKERLLSLKAEASQTATKDTQSLLTFTLEIPALAGQPLFAGAQVVSAGRAIGEVRAVVGAHSQMEARMTVNGLIAAESGQTMPVANLSFRGLVQPNGAVSVEAPLLLDNAGRRSDMDFALELTPLGRGYSVDGRMTGQHVELEDLLGVLGVFMVTAAPDSGERSAPSGTIPPDTVAAWSRFSGHLGLNIASVTRGKDWTMSGLSGTLAIEPARLVLPKLEASFSETSRLSAKMEMRFTGGAMPYRLTGEYALNDFDAGRLFKAFDPDKPATVEGLFNINAKFSGNGETTGRALDRVQGEFALTSSQGIFRGLQRATGKVSMTSKAVELGASVLGSLFGSENVTKTAEKVAGQAYFVDQLAQSLGELNYDQLSVRLTRDELLNMNLEDISLVSPEIRLNGRGDISYVVGKPLLDQPLNASLSFAARGKVEQLLGKLRLLDGSKDDLGYARTKDAVTVGGTLAKPDPTGFFTKIATAKLADFLDTDN